MYLRYIVLGHSLSWSILVWTSLDRPITGSIVIVMSFQRKIFLYYRYLSCLTWMYNLVQVPLVSTKSWYHLDVVHSLKCGGSCPMRHVNLRCAWSSVIAIWLIYFSLSIKNGWFLAQSVIILIFELFEMWPDWKTNRDLC